MPLHIKEKENKESKNILLPFGKDKLDKTLFLKVSGLNFEPEISLGAKDITSFYHPENQKRVFILGLGEGKELNKSYIYYRSFIYQYRSKIILKSMYCATTFLMMNCSMLCLD